MYKVRNVQNEKQFKNAIDVTHDNTSYTVTSNVDVLISTKIRISKATSFKKCYHKSYILIIVILFTREAMGIQY
jgi:hypothetical protein